MVVSDKPLPKGAAPLFRRSPNANNAPAYRKMHKSTQKGVTIYETADAQRRFLYNTYTTYAKSRLKVPPLPKYRAN